MMATQTGGLFLTTSLFSLFILSLHFFQTCDAQNCSPSACGTITNISYPFRLKSDPSQCGDDRFELACENNATFVYLNSHKYYVKEINYDNGTIIAADAAVKNDDICSFPTQSAYDYSFRSFHGYYLLGNSPIQFISCPNPLNNSSSSSLFTDVTHHCASSNSNSNSNSSHSSPRYAYIKVGHMMPSELPQTCELEMIVMTSWEFKDWSNVSLSEIHDSLLYGFQLVSCYWCYSTPTTMKLWLEFRNFFIRRLTSPLLIIPLILAVGPPVMAIIGFIAVVGLITFIAHQFNHNNKLTQSGFDRLDSAPGSDALSSGFISSIMIVCAPRLIIFPLVVWFLIYKFRRRHLSSYNAIESFLQSDTKLAPIRYSYSDIKKMTRGFRDKLGEGVYGSVYKGKLRSGHHVAVKMLGKRGGKGQDFINEIATIGRIHHVNVVKLVGYCAEGSKHALVFDFMPNGSLEKYLFNREDKNALNWVTKFEIAVGVARGIEYLHQGCDVQILHFDIKPHNILLDDKFTPKISDFGLAKFFSTKKNTMTLTVARGTIGYVAPELMNRAIVRVSYKADVYSFGMMLMEIVGLNRDMIERDDESSKYFPCWIYDRFNQGMDIIAIANHVDENDNSDVWKLARKMTIVALWCIQMNPDDRPSMNKVLEMLEADVERLQLPKYPSQPARMTVNVEESSWGTSATDSSSLLHYNNSSSIDITIA